MKNNKYTIVCEGQTEKYLFNELKTDVFENRKIHQCKKHKRKILKGGIGSNDYIDTKNCCIVFYIIDKDDISNEKISEHKNNIENKNGKLIISMPCLEIIILAIFDDNVNVSTTFKEDVYKKLTKELISQKIINEKEQYSKTNNNVLKKIIEFLKNNNEIINKWINNISKLKFKKDNIEFNNFDLIIKFLKGE